MRQIASRHDATLLCYAAPGDENVERLRKEFPVEVVQRPKQSVLRKRASQLRSLASRVPYDVWTTLGSVRVCIVRQRDVYEPQIQRVAEALTRAGYDVEVLCMRGKGQPRATEGNGVRITGLRASLTRGNKLRYAFDYGWFFTPAAATLTGQHLRRRYAAIQVYTMPDFLV